MDAATVRWKRSRSTPFGFTLVEIMIALAIVGVLTAIAVPNFIRFQARSKQSEAKTNLRALFTSEKSYFGEREAYSPFARLIGFTPERGNRYAYRLTPGCGNPEVRAGGAVANASPLTIDCVEVDLGRYPGAVAQPATAGGVPVWLPPANNPTTPASISDAASTLAGCPICSFSGSAAGNVDTDAVIDTWFISSVDATVVAGPCWEGTPAGGNNPAGQPFNLNNDVGC
ncbi:MAG TPA: prepilin-type N-terminal cleavage/methylation domain-containing protein [Myxococcaceae bacterium]|nr:prepilin-type N-terminal cleavage/methylation domain-containing protein [Myxococcaceae bacterium]